ncbi:MAG: DUF5666 domain-containing protein [Burkholderiaceae bacterium]
MFANPLNRKVLLALPLLMILLLLTNCGGGVGSGGTGSGVSTVTVGPISGYGSVIVNGVHFDDSSAMIRSDDGTARTRADLKLGMVTEVDGSDLTTSAGKQTATALSIRIVSEIVGPVTGLDLNTNSLTVLGQTVVVTPATVFDAQLSGGLIAIAPGAIVEVYGRYDAARSQYTATRIESRTGTTFYKLRGPVGVVDSVSKIVIVGGQAISYAGLLAVGNVDALLGAIVRTKLSLAANGGVWDALSLQAGALALPQRDDAQVEGRISAWTSSRQFSVDGIPVDASAAIFTGAESDVVLGGRVEVEGASSGGVLRARVVTIEGDEDASNSFFELDGLIESLDLGARSFSIRGVTVNYGGAVQFLSGGPNDLAIGRSVDVHGTLSRDGASVDALTVSFEGN